MNKTIIWILLAAFLAGQSPAEVRQRSRSRLDSGHRPWRMTGGEGVAPPAGATWSRTMTSTKRGSALWPTHRMRARFAKR